MKRYNFVGVIFCGALLIGGCTSKRETGYSKYEYLLKDREEKKMAEHTQAEEESYRPESHVDELKDRRKKPQGDNYSKNSHKRVKRILQTADSYLGVPYKYGGNTRKGLDCSGLVVNAFKSVDQTLPRASWQQAQVGKNVSKKDLRPGDLVFFSTRKSSRKINHVGIVSSVQHKEINFIHATTSRGVRYDRLDTGYWNPLFQKAVRVEKKERILVGNR